MRCYLWLLAFALALLVGCDETAPTVDRDPPIATLPTPRADPAPPKLPEAGPKPRDVTTGAPAPATSYDTRGLPAEVQDVLASIDSGRGFRYKQDGGTFQNRERRLPEREHGYYREYTVPTPGSRDRGARRLVTGGDPPTEIYYTGDHYKTFRRLALRGTR